MEGVTRQSDEEILVSAAAPDMNDTADEIPIDDANNTATLMESLTGPESPGLGRVQSGESIVSVSMTDFMKIMERMNEAAEERARRFGVSRSPLLAEPRLARTSTPTSNRSGTAIEENSNSIEALTPQRAKSKTSSRRNRTTSSSSLSEVEEGGIMKSGSSSSSSSPEKRPSKDSRSPDRRTTAVARGRKPELRANKKQRGHDASSTRKENSRFESRRRTNNPKIDKRLHLDERRALEIARASTRTWHAETVPSEQRVQGKQDRCRKVDDRPKWKESGGSGRTRRYPSSSGYMYICIRKHVFIALRAINATDAWNMNTTAVRPSIPMIPAELDGKQLHSMDKE